MLELDLILDKFNQRYLAGLDPDQLERYVELLAFADNDLLDLVMDRATAADPRFNNILLLLRAA